MAEVTPPPAALALVLRDDQPYFRGWHPDDVASLVFVLSAIGLVLVAFFITYILFDRRARRRVLEERWDLFRRMCRDRALTREEISFLRRLQQKFVPDRPHLLVTSLNFYDGCVEQEVRRMEAEGLPFEGRSGAANAFVNIREKLFFGEAMAKARVESTLDLEPHQALQVEVPGKTRTYGANVLSVNESSLTISMPSRRGEQAELRRGDRVVVYLAVKNDAGYRFETGVAGIRDSRIPAVHLWHTEKIQRQQLRTWMRMSMEVPVRFHRVGFPDLKLEGDQLVSPEQYSTARHEGVFGGMMRDFSLGGVCLRSEEAFKRGEYAGVLIPIFGPGDGEPEEEIEILGRVVGCTELETIRNQLYNMHIQFVPLDDETRSILMANMFQLQRRLGKKRT
ncbi:MAG: PilZ domain-containing protein [Planctomycetota bacterium]